MHSIEYHLSWQKRAFDICISLVLVTVLLPVFCGIVLCILATAGHPVFFLQERIGHNKKPFKMLKFRTMHVNADKLKKKLMKKNEAPWPMFKMRQDPRFTKVGWFLSRTGLDEIPQFFHVLAGTMSIIGPRPLPTSEASQLPSSWNFRYKVKPGILSEWAVSPDRYKSLNRWRTLEKMTVQNGSIKNDLRLILSSFSYLYKGNFTSLLNKGNVRARRALPRISSQSSSVTTRKRAPLGSLA